jgi:sulfoxide reductase heme-binding subunit YedZ
MPVTGRGPSDRVVRLGLKPLAFALSLSPVALLVWDVMSHQLNANPFNAIVRSTGFWSIRFLCLTVAVTPFRWLTGWHGVVRFRRMLGLFAFFYGALHVLAYVVFDRFAGLGAPDGAALLARAAQTLKAVGVEVVTRPFFAIGSVAFVLLVPLAATSTPGMMRRMGGRRWRELHRLVYPALILGVVHTHWPLTAREPLYALIAGIVIMVRLAKSWHARQTVL